MKTKLTGDFLQFAGFLVSGGIAAACNIGSRALFNLVLSYEISIVLAYVVGMLVAFTIMRMFVFKPPTEASKRAQFVKFSIVNVLGLAQTLAISELVARWLGPSMGLSHAETIGHVLGVGAPVVTSYFGHKYFSFRQKAKA